MGALQQIERAEQAQHAGDGGDRPQPVVVEKGELARVKVTQPAKRA